MIATSPSVRNRRWVLTQRPQGRSVASCFELQEEQVKPLQVGEASRARMEGFVFFDYRDRFGLMTHRFPVSVPRNAEKRAVVIGAGENTSSKREHTLLVKLRVTPLPADDHYRRINGDQAGIGELRVSQRGRTLVA